MTELTAALEQAQHCAGSGAGEETSGARGAVEGEDEEMLEMLQEKDKEIEELTVRCHELMLQKKQQTQRAADAEARLVDAQVALV